MAFSFGPTGTFRIDLGKAYKGWQAGWDRAMDDTQGANDLHKGVHGIFLGLGGATKAGVLGHTNVFGRQMNPTAYNPNPDPGDAPLRTHVAGQANNFGRFGDISQQGLIVERKSKCVPTINSWSLD